MNLGLAIFLIIIALLIGLIGGFYGARAYMKKYFQDNPPISEDMSPFLRAVLRDIRHVRLVVKLTSA